MLGFEADDDELLSTLTILGALGLVEADSTASDPEVIFEPVDGLFSTIVGPAPSLPPPLAAPKFPEIEIEGEDDGGTKDGAGLSDDV